MKSSFKDKVFFVVEVIIALYYMASIFMLANAFFILIVSKHFSLLSKRLLLLTIATSFLILTIVSFFSLDTNLKISLTPEEENPLDDLDNREIKAETSLLVRYAPLLLAGLTIILAFGVFGFSLFYDSISIVITSFIIIINILILLRVFRTETA